MGKQEDDFANEYHQRRIRWTNRSLDQFSIFNNLLISLGIGFLAFAYDTVDSKQSVISLSLSEIDWILTFLRFSTIFIYFSICIGLFIALSRLWDFRITRQINRVRQNAYEQSNKRKLPQGSTGPYSFIESIDLYWKLIIRKYPNITFEQCKDVDNNFLDEFNELRKISNKLGYISWSSLNIEAFFLWLGITLHVIGQLLN